MGSFRQMTGGPFITYQLPHTYFKINIPTTTIKFKSPCLRSITGDRVFPNIPINSEIAFEYFLNRKDPEVERAYELILSERQL